MNENQLLKVRASQDNFYVNLDLYNDNSYNIDCKANIVSTDPILQSGQSYQCAFIRGLVPLSAVPYFDANDINAHIAVYVPDTIELQRYQTIAVKNYYTPTTAGDTGVYSIASYLKAINASLEKALQFAYLGQTRPAGAAANSLKFSYDGDKFSFEAPAGFAVLNIEIWMNDDMQNLLGGFEYSRHPAAHPLMSNCRYTLRFKEYAVNNKITEEESSINNWNSNDTLLFTSSRLPLINEQTGSFTSSNSSVPMSILTDFFTTGVNFKVPITIIPINNRYATLDSCPNLYSFDIETYIRNKSGQIKPLRIAPGQHFSVKLEFRKN